MTATSADYADRAKRYSEIRTEKGWRRLYRNWLIRLTAMGLPKSEGSITVKINRGAFPAWFLIAAMESIGASSLRLRALIFCSWRSTASHNNRRDYQSRRTKDNWYAAPKYLHTPTKATASRPTSALSQPLRRIPAMKLIVIIAAELVRPVAGRHRR